MEPSDQTPVVSPEPSTSHGWKLQIPRVGAIALLVMVVLGALLAFNSGNGKHEQLAATNKAQTAHKKAAAVAKPVTTTATTPTTPEASAPVTKPAVTKPVSSPTTTAPTLAPAPAATPWVNNTNCIPQQEPQYAYYKNKTNSQYLQTNGYANTTKLYAAFQFAGMIDQINSKQYVVFAMDDSAWDALPASEVTWMNASPTNMRSVLGWQVATYCITYDGVNPIKDRTTALQFNSLNGPETWTPGNGTGYIDGKSVAIWDWFTSNGSVTITPFIHPPAGH